MDAELEDDHTPVYVKRPIPHHEVDLDLPPRERWKDIVLKYKHHFGDILAYMAQEEREEFGGPLLGPMLGWLGGFCGLCNAWYESEGYYLFPEELREELEGIAEVLIDVGLSPNKLVLLNLGYDYLARCTSAVVQGSSDGPPMHLRNMDWEVEQLKDVTIDVTFIRRGRQVFRATTWVGFIGVFTAMRYATPESSSVENRRSGGYSLSLNYRWIGKPIGYWRSFIGALSGAWPISMLLRHAVQQTESYDEVLCELANRRTIAPCYLILCGTERSAGAIITRHRFGEAKSRLSLSDDLHCIVQTNIDHDKNTVEVEWAVDDELLHSAVERRIKAEKFFAGRPANISSALGFECLLTHPVCNNQTVYSSVMCPATDEYCSFIIDEVK